MRRLPFACLLALLLLPAGLARAQLGALTGSLSNNPQPSSREPVTFRADQVQYDRTNNLVIATGHVEAWQNGHVLRADKVVFDRTTGTAAATGHVVLMETDGEVMFADYAELSQDMKDGVLKDMRALLAENGKLAANGARRTGGEINELSRVVYSPCNLCKKDPTRPPLWQITAYSGVQDLEHKRDEYYDAELQNVRPARGLVPVHLRARSFSEARVRPADAVFRLQQRSRGILRAAVLLGAR